MAAAGYVVSAHKATSVRHAIKAYFTSPTEQNLILSKANRIEIHTLSLETGTLHFDHEFTVYGRVTVIQAFRPEDARTDHIVVGTDMYDYFTLSWDAEEKTIVNERSIGNLHDHVLRQPECGSISLVDPLKRCMVMHLYQGLLSIVPMAQPSRDKRKKAKLEVGQLEEPYGIRLPELNVVALSMVHSEKKNPVVAVLYRDNEQQRRMKTYEIALKGEKELTETELKAGDLDQGAKLLIGLPAPVGGLIIVGEQTITYFHEELQSPLKTAIDPTIFSAYAQIDADGSRYLLGDDYGNLYVLLLIIQDSVVRDIQVSKIGETSIPSTLAYLDAAHVFVGSHYGDSQLIQILGERDAETGMNIRVLQSMTNLAPISDFALISQSDQGGEGQIVTCSGAYRDGSLRVVKHGVGLDELAVVGDMPGIRHVWALKPDLGSDVDSTLVISFVNETRVLRLDPNSEEGDIEELEEFNGFALNEPTLATANITGGQLVQVTPSQVLVVDAEGGMVRATWSAPETKIITASIARDKAVVALGGGVVVLLNLTDGAVEVARSTFPHEIACVDISPEGGPFCSVGLWTQPSVHLLSLPELKVVASEELGGQVIPRNTLVTQLADVPNPVLMVSMGDGTLYTYSVDATSGSLSDRKATNIGTHELRLTRMGYTNSVFATSDRPTIIYGSRGRIAYSAVNLREAVDMTPFNSPAFPSSLVIASEDGLKIGAIDSIQKLHIRTVPLGELPRRIVHHPHAKVFGVLTMKLIVDETTGDEDQRSYLRIVDDATFDIPDAFEMDEWEMVSSIACLPLAENGKDLIVVGTGYSLPEDDEAKKGRLLVFEVTGEKRLSLVSEMETKGNVYCIDMVEGHLVFGSNSVVYIYSYNPTAQGADQFKQIASKRSATIVLTLSVKGSIIVVGDLMKSVFALRFNTADNSLEEIARDYTALWMTAVDAIDDDTYVGGEAEGNLVIYKRDTTAPTELEQARLQIVSEFKVGEMVNKIRQGQLVSSLSPAETEGTAVTPKSLFVTVDGSISIFGVVNPDKFDLLDKLQNNLTHVIRGVGGLEHAPWRALRNERRYADAPLRCIDGDLIEQFLELSPEDQKAVVEGNTEADRLPVSLEEVGRIVEDLARFH
ncbi:DNA damage-binding protein 1a [Saitoella coloradoensis]